MEEAEPTAKRRKRAAGRSAIKKMGGFKGETEAFRSVYSRAVDKLRKLVVGRRDRPQKRTGLGVPCTAEWRSIDVDDDPEQCARLNHFRRAMKLTMPKADPGQLPAQLVAAIDEVVACGAETEESRRKRMAVLREVADDLRPFSVVLAARRKEHVQWAAADTHPALWAAVSDAIEWPNADFAAEATLLGHAVVGDCPPTGVWRKRSASEIAAARAKFRTPRDVIQDNTEWNAQNAGQMERRFASAKSTQDEEALAKHTAAWDATTSEVKKGTAIGPFTQTQLDVRFGRQDRRQRWRGMSRFAIWQGKWRPCDNARASGTNSAYTSTEAVVMPRPDLPVQVGRYFAAKLRGQAGVNLDTRMEGAVEDEQDAYRNSPVAEQNLTVVALVNPQTGRTSYFIPKGLNFGLASAVAIYSEKAEFIATAACLLLAAPVAHFVDDFICLEPRFAHGAESRAHRSCPQCKQGDPTAQCGKACLSQRFPWSAQGVLYTLMDWLAHPPAAKKHLPWSERVTWIGVVTDFSDPEVYTQQVKESSREKAIRLLEEALTAGRLSPAQAASLRGICQWVLCNGTLGRAALQCLTARQKRTDRAGDWRLDAELKEGLRFLRYFYTHALPAVQYPVFPLDGRDQRPVVILTDASWEQDTKFVKGDGEMGYIVAFPATDAGGEPEIVYASAHPSEELVAFSKALKAKKQLVGYLETVALACPYFDPAIAPRLQGRDVIHFGDNKGANGAVVKGSSKAPDMARVISNLRRKWLDLGVSPWVHYVNTKMNWADDPSRGAFDSLEAAGARRVDFFVPSDFYSWGPEEVE